jgi:8-oxo-dGTP pyrophosphatase MutT (NUDIX family)
MLVRNCAGGVVFFEDKVLLLKNEKNEWVLPKGVIRDGELAADVAKKRVKEEAGVEAKIVSSAGRTNYEFYSYSRKTPVCNQITWYIMEAECENFAISKEDGFVEGGFFPVEKALETITYSQDKSLVSVSYRRLLSDIV